MKLFVFDLDGTLLNSKKELSKRSESALCRIVDLGHRISIATARPPRAIRNIVNSLSFPIDTVFYNGSLVRGVSLGEKSYTIPQHIFNEIYSWVASNDPNAVISVEVSDNWFSASTFNFCDFFYISEGPQKLPIDKLLNTSPNKVLINSCSTSSKMIEIFGNLVNILVTDQGTLVQIMPQGVSKEKAIEFVLSHYGMTFDDVICFGDDHNDIGLFEKSGFSVAMGNSIDEIKKIATHQTGTNDDDGVASFLENFV